MTDHMEKKLEIRQIYAYDASVILPLYQSVGWTAYTDSPETLRHGFEGSLLILGAYEGESLCGLIRVVGDGHTVIFVQDILVYPEHQRKGLGTRLLREIMNRYAHVRQLQLSTDNTPKTTAFYRSTGFQNLSDLGCCGFMRV